MGVKKLYIVLCFPLFVLYVSCSTADKPMKDGYYTAEAAEFDEHNWKEYVTVCVSGGRVILVEYNAYNPAGFVKSWDMNYMRIMNAVDGTYPNAYTRAYTQQFISLQDTARIDVLVGATNSYHSFVRLMNAALQNARLGDDAIRLVNLSVRDKTSPGRVVH